MNQIASCISLSVPQVREPAATARLGFGNFVHATCLVLAARGNDQHLGEPGLDQVCIIAKEHFHAWRAECCVT